MAVFQSDSCGHCKTIWSNRMNAIIGGYGPPKVKCSTCGGINGTGMKWARDSSKKEKNILWFRLCLRTEIWFVIISFIFIGTGIKMLTEGEGEDGQGAIAMGVVFGGIAMFMAMRVKRKLFESEADEIDYLRIYDADGYLSSELYTAMFD